MIKWIIIAIIGLVILGALGFDIRKAVDAPETQSNLGYAKSAVNYVWTKYLSGPANMVWHEGVIKYIWDPFFKYLDEKMRSKDFTTMRLNETQKNN